MQQTARKTKYESNRREALMLAAAQLFDEKGFRATTVRDIAKATGMQSGSPFYHFASKQHLLHAVTMEGLEGLVETLEEVSDTVADPVECFRTLTKAHICAILQSNPGILTVVSTEWRHLEGEHLSDVMALRDRVDSVWQKVFEGLAKAGAIEDASSIRRLFYLGSLTSVKQWYRSDGPVSPEQLADALSGELLR